MPAGTPRAQPSGCGPSPRARRGVDQGRRRRRAAPRELARPGRGHGLPGMAERAGLYAGTLPPGPPAGRHRLAGQRELPGRWSPRTDSRRGALARGVVSMSADRARRRHGRSPCWWPTTRRLVRSGFRLMLEQQPDLSVCAEAGTGTRRSRCARRLRPDVVLMDIRMPGTDGHHRHPQLVAATESDPVLVLTTFDLDEYVVEALRAGASGYLLKDVDPAELVRGVREVAGGELSLAPAVLHRVVRSSTSPAPRRTTALRTLSAREREVLGLLGQRDVQQPRSAQRLVVSLPTAKSHVASVLAKLDARDRAQAAIIAHRRGSCADRAAPRRAGPQPPTGTPRGGVGRPERRVMPSSTVMPEHGVRPGRVPGAASQSGCPARQRVGPQDVNDWAWPNRLVYLGPSCRGRSPRRRSAPIAQ